MNRLQKILLLSSYFWYFGEGLLGPLYAVFTQRIGGDVLEVTGAYALFLLTMGVLSIYVGKVSDRYSKKHMMAAGYVMNAIATFGYLLVDSPLKLFVLQGILGVATALATPTWNSLFSKHSDRRHMGESWGLDDGGSQIVGGLAVIIGGLVVTYFGFPILFVIMGTAQILSVLVLIRMFEQDKT